jgi:hypothetical protein
MKTNLTVKLEYVTPELAENYLKFNPKNRDVNEANLKLLTNEMKYNRYKENGESIVFDKHGELKDGQHRLMAVINSGHSYFFPIVRGVEADCMATYDTGKNRSAADVLKLNGFKQSMRLSSLISIINRYVAFGSKSKSYSNALQRGTKLTNQQILDYCQSNYDWLKEIIKKCDNILSSEKFKVLNLTQLGFIAYMLGGEEPSDTVYEFLSHLIGRSRVRNTAPNYIYTKLYNAKVNKESIHFYWTLGMTIKAYNHYIDGNPAITYYRFNTEQELPKITRKLKLTS